MKNILVISLYNLSTFHHKGEVANYLDLSTVCYKSFMTNLVDLDEIIIFTGTKDDYNKMFREKFYRLMDLHKTRKCNILYVDADVVCTKKTKIFNRFNHFTMFYICKDLRHRKYPFDVPVERYSCLDPWFMMNVQYYPADLDNGVWSVGKTLADNWIDVWAYECIIYNAMIHSQNVDLQSLCIPKYNYQHLPKQQYEFETYIPLEDAHIVHVPATRGSRKSLTEMKRLFYGG